MEELQALQRKEQRDLQSRITQKKKQASKKTRKGVNEECDKLELELKQKHASEVAALSGDTPEHEFASEDDAPSEQLEKLDFKTDSGKQAHATTNGSDHHEDPSAAHVANNESSVSSGLKKPNRQKARLAKRAAEVEEQARQATEEAKNMPDMKQQERTRMLESMKERGLREQEIRADGHCLYSAVADQLEQLNVSLGSAPTEKPVLKYKAVREAAASYIEQHPDDFAPFLEEPLPEYLHKIRDTGEWGGQLELMALAKSYSMDINVLQDFGRVEKIVSGSSGEGKTMWLGYYKHGFGLGEHYNSLRKAP